MDAEIRRLERSAASGDLGANRRLAVARFRLEGDCGTGLCGNSSQTVPNPSVNNPVPLLPACPTCAAKAVRLEAWRDVRAALGARPPSNVRRFVQGLVGWNLKSVQRSEPTDEPTRRDLRRKVILILNGLGTGWFKLTRKNHQGPRGWKFVVTFEPGSPPDDYLVECLLYGEGVYAFSPRGTRVPT